MRVIGSLCVVALSMGELTCARKPADSPYNLKPVAQNVWAAIDNPGVRNPSGANAGVVIGNAVFAQAGAAVLADRHVRDWIHTENLRLLTDAAAAFHDTVRPEQRARIEAFVPPTVLYEHGIDLFLGARQLIVRSLPGHTGGDSVVFVPDVKVTFTGDLFWDHTMPNTVDGSTDPWVNTLDAFVSGHPDDTFVPGHGEIGTARDVLAFREYLVTLRTLVANAQLQPRPVLETVLPQLEARYGAWGAFEYLAQPNIVHMDAELRGTKRVPGGQSHK